jgi:hypothetical protein
LIVQITNMRILASKLWPGTASVGGGAAAHPGRWKRSAAIVAMIGAMHLAAPVHAAEAQKPPWDGCTAVPKIQYDSAKKQYLLVNRFGSYVRTGRFWRHYYWYCH